jgi:putative colanic acid biosynthesis acetyltransferase WcaF
MVAQQKNERGIMQGKVNLAAYNNSQYRPGSFVKRMAWMLVSFLFFKNPLLPFYGLKTFWLRVFGAAIGKGLVIKPGVTVKYPWFLQVGDHCWIGENVWIDNLAMVILGDNVCISQGALLLCGNHNYKKINFDLITEPITLEDGVWIGARAVVCAGVICASHSILTVGSVAVRSLEAYGIYQGNPAQKMKERMISD